MNQTTLKRFLADLPLGQLEYHPTIGSTNDRAAKLAEKGAPDLTLVIADEQTKGRGRGGRPWFTPPNAALAFTLLLRPPTLQDNPARFSGLGALAVCMALEEFDLNPKIKWPNDVLLRGKKVCGVLAEARWLGGDLEALLLGIGINIAPQSVPPAEQLTFPAASLEEYLSAQVNRWALLKAVLIHLITWRTSLESTDFIQAWDNRLAFKQESAQVFAGEKLAHQGRILGLAKTGALRLLLENGQEQLVEAGEIHLRPLVDSDAK